MGWERNEYGACKCHNKTFCPDWILHSYEDDLPIFIRKSDAQRIQNLTEKTMTKSIIEMEVGETFLYQFGLYKRGEAETYPNETGIKQIWCKQIAFQVDGIWHETKREVNENFNPYYEAELATLKIVVE